jgi:tetratricopeptide (TPR) repeat protein
VAQPFVPDTLLQQLQSEKRDTSRVIILGSLSRAYQYYKPDTALLLAQQGLALAKKIGFIKGQALCTRRLAAVLAESGEHPKALELFFDALKEYESINDAEGISGVFVGIGIIYVDEGDYRESLNYYFKAKEISQKIHNEFGILVNVSNIGETYEKLNQLDSARIYTQQAYEISRHRHDNVGIGIALNNLGKIYNKMQQPAVALEYYRASLPYQQKGHFNDGICETYLNIARLFQQRANRIPACIMPDSHFKLRSRKISRASF